VGALMLRFLTVLLIVSYLPGCAAVGPLPVNIEPQDGAHAEIVATALLADDDYPKEYLSDEDDFEDYVFQTLVTFMKPLNLSEEQKVKYQSIAEEVRTSLQEDVVSIAYETDYEEKMAYHQVTAGLINLSYEQFLTKFSPAEDWAPNTATYRGGTRAVDEIDALNRPLVFRERMYIGIPWYATGAPDLDITKHEAVVYTEASSHIHWIVRESANESVFLDIGYVRFSKYGEDQTLVVFNSIHRVDAGWLCRALPTSMESMLTRFVLRDVFSASIEAYQDLLVP
jgi:hypothetical protein